MTINERDLMQFPAADGKTRFTAEARALNFPVVVANWPHEVRVQRANGGVMTFTVVGFEGDFSDGNVFATYRTDSGTELMVFAARS